MLSSHVEYNVNVSCSNEMENEHTDRVNILYAVKPY